MHLAKRDENAFYFNRTSRAWHDPCAAHMGGPNGELLLTSNTTLKKSYIRKLKEFRFSALYVKSYPDEPVENLVGPVKQETLVHARETLQTVAETAVTSSCIDFARVRETVEDIVDQVLSIQMWYTTWPTSRLSTTIHTALS